MGAVGAKGLVATVHLLDSAVRSGALLGHIEIMTGFGFGMVVIQVVSLVLHPSQYASALIVRLTPRLLNAYQ